MYHNNLCDQFDTIRSRDDIISDLRFFTLSHLLFPVFLHHISELLRAPFKAGKLPNGGVGLLINYNNEDILIPAEVTTYLSAEVLFFYFFYHFFCFLGKKILCQNVPCLSFFCMFFPLYSIFIFNSMQLCRIVCLFEIFERKEMKVKVKPK
jgi:hypothetical protein